MFKRVQPHSLVLIIVCIVMLLSWWVTYYNIEIFYDEVVDGIKRENGNLTIAFEEHVNRIFSQADDFTLYVKNEYEKSDTGISRLTDYFKIVGAHTFVNQATIADESGKVLVYMHPSAMNFDMSDVPQFKVQKEATSEFFFIGSVRKSLANGKHIVPVSRRLTKPDGTFAGAVTMGLDIVQFTSFYDAMRLKPYQGLNLLSLDGTIVVFRLGEKQVIGANISSGAVIEAFRQQGDAGTIVGKTAVDGIERFISYRKLQKYPFIVAAGIDKNTALTSYYHYRNKQIGMTIVFSFAALIVAVFSYKLVKALRQSEVLKDHIVNQSLIGTATVAPKTLAILEANDYFAGLTQYPALEIHNLTLYELFIDSVDELQSLDMKDNNQLMPAIRSLTTKGGAVREVERAISTIQLEGRAVYLLTFLDITEERKLERRASHELQLAGSLQHTLLPVEIDTKHFELCTLYSPVHIVSGDHYNYFVHSNGEILNGYLVDVTGHGLATALETSAVRVIMDEYLQKNVELTRELVDEINHKLINTLSEGNFVALVSFQFDFKKSELSLAACGINKILSSSMSLEGVVRIPGTYLGVFKNPDISLITIPILHQDRFYFATDGLTDLIEINELPDLRNFEDTRHYLTGLAYGKKRWDDCSGIFIKLKNPSHTVYRLTIKSRDDMITIRCKVRDIFTQYAPNIAPKLEIATQEAINNSLRAGTQIIVKISILGRKIVVRVQDNGPGFEGNAKLAYINSLTEDEVTEGLWNESGRGLFIMKQFSEKIMYNKKGNQVLLMATI